MKILDKISQTLFPKCEHKVVRLNSVTGDPLVRKYKCVKCGKKSVENLVK